MFHAACAHAAPTQATPNTRGGESGGKKRKWEDNSKAARAALGLSADAAPWTGKRGVALRGLVGLPRERDILDLAWAKACQDQGKELGDTSAAKGLFCDTSQSFGRSGKQIDHLTTQLTGSRKYSFELDQCLLSCDLLGVLGFPTRALDGLSEEQARSLVGECVAAQEMGTVVFALLTVVKSPGLFSDSAWRECRQRPGPGAPSRAAATAPQPPTS